MQNTNNSGQNANSRSNSNKRRKRNNNSRKPRRFGNNNDRAPYVTSRNYNNKNSIISNRPNMKLTIERNRFEAIPDVMETCFDYYENNYRFDLGTTDALLNFDLNINDPYDPYASLGGKSAMFFTQLMSLYRYARVYRAHIVIKYVDNPAANTCPIQTALIYNSEGVVYNNWDDVCSLPLSKRILQLNYPTRVGSTMTIKGTFYPFQSFSQTKEQWYNLPAGSPYDVTNIGSITSPVTKSIVSVYWGRVDNTNTDQLSNRASILVKYYVRLYDRQSFSE